MTNVDEVRAARALLEGSVIRYDRPFDSAVAPGDWDVDR